MSLTKHSTYDRSRVKTKV